MLRASEEWSWIDHTFYKFRDRDVFMLQDSFNMSIVSLSYMDYETV